MLAGGVAVSTSTVTTILGYEPTTGRDDFGSRVVHLTQPDHQTLCGRFGQWPSVRHELERLSLCHKCLAVAQPKDAA